ncbi:MAG: dodecin domain-containing protein [Euzebyales bacterium]|nr:dodecin domain-containing protein [Euzebyales bacterium]
MAVLNSIELQGVSETGWREAANEALSEAGRTLRHIRRMDVLGTSAAVGSDGAVTEYRAQVRLTFEVETAHEREGRAGATPQGRPPRAGR